MQKLGLAIGAGRRAAPCPVAGAAVTLSRHVKAGSSPRWSTAGIGEFFRACAIMPLICPELSGQLIYG
jgi:hypothetical protein